MNLIRNMKELFTGKSIVAEQFDKTLSVKIKCDMRVRRRRDNLLGKVFQTGTIETRVGRVPAISVQHDDGSCAMLVAAEEYTSIPRRGF